jgi:hypothetical protein
MELIKKITLCAFLPLVFQAASCKKYLDEPSNKSLSVITDMDDLQALLDNSGSLNYTGANAQEVSADDYYITDADWSSLTYETNQRMYTWQKENLFRSGDNGNDWNNLYRVVYYGNTVLEKLKGTERTSSNKTVWDNIKGQALVFRAVSFLDAVQIWSPAYDQTSASAGKGIPLRLESDFNLLSVRASVQQSYQQVISDLKAAVPLLPASQVSVHRPSKAAAYGLLARTYLWMREYQKAGMYADSCLQIKNTLINYNSLKPADTYPVKQLNAEIIFERGASLGEVLAIGRAKIVAPLFLSYAENDLRKSAFFKANSDGSVSFKGYYAGSGAVYTGLATDEMYLIRAECYARADQTTEALADLNTLMLNRWKTNKFQPLTASSPEEALAIILSERRKELLMRGLRWMDIKRLNKEGANISLNRTINNQNFTLSPNDPGFALSLPQDIEVYMPIN